MRPTEYTPDAVAALLRKQKIASLPELTLLNYIRTTCTTTGLRLRAHLVRKQYEKGVKIPESLMRELPITQDSTLPKWNYTLGPP